MSDVNEAIPRDSVRRILIVRQDIDKGKHETSRNDTAKDDQYAVNFLAILKRSISYHVCGLFFG